jgi:ABC-type protease/lipase transport system fused ATPase/permease subunit
MLKLQWRMHELSDGQRRRVQLLLGLIRPFDLLVMDEITVDLDVVTRQDFMTFLKAESESRGATIVYATHIFDGLEDWATDLAYMSFGRLTKMGALESFTDLQTLRGNGAQSALLQVCWVPALMRAIFAFPFGTSMLSVSIGYLVVLADDCAVAACGSRRTQRRARQAAPSRRGREKGHRRAGRGWQKDQQEQWLGRRANEQPFRLGDFLWSRPSFRSLDLCFSSSHSHSWLHIPSCLDLHSFLRNL